MTKKSNKGDMPFPMTKAERIYGMAFIPIHAVVLPILVPLVCLKLTDGKMSAPNMNLWLYVVSFLAILIGMSSYLRKSFGDFFNGTLRSVKAIIVSYAANYIMMYVLSTVFILIVGDTVINPNTEAIFNDTRLNANVMMVVGVLLAPVVEEAMFRGALFGTIRRKSRAAAYIISALLFTVYHLWQYFVADGFSWELVLYLIQYIPASVALAWCYEKSGSIWAPMVTHALINFVSLSISLNVNM